MPDGSGISISRFEGEAHSWAMAARAPDPRLGSCVMGYVGYRELAREPMRRLQPPFAGLPMILSFGPEIDIINGDRPAARDTHESFLAGLHDVHVLTEYSGAQRGLQVNFTLLGAYRLLNVSMSDLANRCVKLGDLLGPEAERLLDRLHSARDWPARFDIMDRFLLARLAARRPMSPDIAWALKSLRQSRGGKTIGALTRELGCSRRHLIQRFHAQVGLSPKSVAGILRFEHAVDAIREADEQSWADLAIACGYYDQAHFNRDFRRYSGRTPTEFRAALLPSGGGIAA